MGCVLTALGCVVDSAPLVVLGFLGIGGMNGAVLLARTAVADMYPESRKARAISYVLFGALFGAALGPLVFRPLFAGKDLELDTLVVPWFAAAAMCVVGLILTLAIRPDPRTIALELEREGLAPGAAPTTDLRRRSARSASARCPGRGSRCGRELGGHGQRDESEWLHRRRARPPASGRLHRISVHIVGMFGLVLVVGQLVDRVGRHRALIAGLLIMAVSTVMLAWVV